MARPPKGRIKRPPRNPDLEEGSGAPERQQTLFVRPAKGEPIGPEPDASHSEERIDRFYAPEDENDPIFETPPPIVNRDLRGDTLLKKKNASRNTLTLAVALLALGGFAAIVGYAYTTGQSDQASALIPVIEPDPGPVRQKPSDPGGLQVPHTDKGVLNDTGDDGQEEAVEQLLPTPEVPAAPPQNSEVSTPDEQLADGQQPVGQQIVENVLTQEAPAANLAQPGSNLDTTTIDAGNNTEDLSAEALTRRVEELTRKIEELEGSASQQAPAPSPPVAAPPAPQVAEPEPAQEPPAPPPAAQPTPQPAPQPAPVAAAPAAPAASTGRSGDIRIQLGALRSEEAARSEWDRLSRRYPSILGDLELIIQPVEVQGRGTFYRIQGGFFDAEGADTACIELEGQGQPCIIRP